MQTVFSFVLLLFLISNVAGELFLGYVTSKRAHARIVSVDTSKALTLPGVHGYVDHTDVPGNNRWGIVIKEEELFASKEVLYHSQIIGAIAAETREIAQKAAGMVEVTYEDLKPVLTIEVWLFYRRTDKEGIWG